MNTFGQHFLVEYYGCNAQILDRVDRIEELMNSAAVAAEARVVTSAFHRFAPQGVSGVVVIEESHLSIHTWPECGYAAVDFYTCGDCLPERAHEVLGNGLEAERSEVMVVHRGTFPPGPSMRVCRHDRSVHHDHSGDAHGSEPAQSSFEPAGAYPHSEP